MQSIPGCTYGGSEVAESPVSMVEFDRLKQSVGFAADEEMLEEGGG